MRLDAQPAHVVALSLGGAVAQQLALDYPSCAQSGSGQHRIALRLSDWRQRMLGLKRFAGVYLQGMDKVAEGVAAVYSRYWNRRRCAGSGQTDRVRRPRPYRSSLWAMARFDATFLLELITCPTLIIAGEQDQTVSLAAKQILAQGIPNSRLVIIANSGHATPIDQPEAFNRAVLEFLNTIP